MEIPWAFRQFSGFFYPHGYEEFASEDKWIAHNFNVLPAEERAVLKQFLDELLSGRYSDEDLADIWASTSPVYDFRPCGHRYFFRKVRDMMG
jgi:hypothetical protein